VCGEELQLHQVLLEKSEESSCVSVFDLFFFFLKKKAFEVVVGCLYMCAHVAVRIISAS
jgi:hypothetical protein